MQKLIDNAVTVRDRLQKLAAKEDTPLMDLAGIPAKPSRLASMFNFTGDVERAGALSALGEMSGQDLEDQPLGIRRPVTNKYLKGMIGGTAGLAGGTALGTALGMGHESYALGISAGMLSAFAAVGLSTNRAIRKQAETLEGKTVADIDKEKRDEISEKENNRGAVAQVLRAVVGAASADRGKLRAVKGTYTGDKGKPLPRYRDALLSAVYLPQVSPVLDFIERNKLRKQIREEKAKGK